MCPAKSLLFYFSFIPLNTLIKICILSSSPCQKDKDKIWESRCLARLCSALFMYFFAVENEMCKWSQINASSLTGLCAWALPSNTTREGLLTVLWLYRSRKRMTEEEWSKSCAKMLDEAYGSVRTQRQLSCTKNKNSVIIYSSSSCSKPAWVSFFCRRTLAIRQLLISQWLP